MAELYLYSQQLAAHKAQQCIAREQLAAMEEAAQHEEDYRQKEADEKLHTLQLELGSNNLQNEQLKLEVLRWRKQCSLMRLKLASAREKVQLHESNLDLLSEREQRLSSDAAGLRGQLASALQQLTDMTAAKAQAQAEAAKFQSQALQADMQLTQMNEELKLLTGRCSNATTHSADVQQRLAAALSEKASLQKQLADSEAREAAAAAETQQLQQSLQALQGELRRCEERLAAQEKAAAAAEAAAAVASAKVEAAADALAMKEQQLVEWRQLAQASKDTASQQLQLSQDKMGLRETRLLDEVAALRQQLAQEKAARAAADSGLTSASAAAAAKAKSLEEQLAQLNQQMTSLQSQLSAAQQQAKQQCERAAALELELEKQQEQETRAAVQAVGSIMQGLVEQEGYLQPAAARAAAGPAAGAAAAKGGGKAAAASKAAASGKAAAARGRPRSAGAAGRPRKAQAKAAAAIAAAAEGESEGPDEPDSGDEVGSQLEEQSPPARRGRPKKAVAPAAVEMAEQASPVQQHKESDRVLQPLDENQQPAQEQPAAVAGKVAVPAAAAAAAAAAPAAPATRPSGVDQAGGSRPSSAAAPAGPPPLRFVPQSTLAPTAALQKPGVMAAAQARVSATDMLKKLSAGLPQGIPGKPGARKRKLLPAAVGGAGGSMDVIPASLLVKPAFQAPKVRKP
ncbi:hypothetical protein OEZ85_008168 [Tetradesmus obliquus]|uniref:Uncharacterized protein n=1 Tax=Tetradesmus obliquus TaxID=3088 RepID=A0ABY8TID0_TETOB|nr:hypothetical protein OEZ85_008168 [Tetradesmus obliquus]